MDTLEKEMNEVRQEIAAIKADLAQAKAEGSIARRDRLEEYLLELQKEKNTVMQAAAPSSTTAPTCVGAGGVGMDRLIEVVGEVVRREIAPLQMSLNYVLSELLDPWEKIQTDSSSVNDESAPKKEELERYYNIETNNCMLLGTLPDQHFCANIQRAHIWPKHTHGRGLEILELSPHDLNSPRNYLLLQAEIEYYFDRKKFILLPVNIDHGNFSLRVVVLDPELLKENIRISSHSKKRSFNFPWSALNGLVSDHVFSEEKKPFLRMIAQHAFSSMKNAISSGVVEESFCSSLRSETIELARRSLGEDSIKRVSEPNGLMSLLVNVSSIAEEEAQIESRKSIT